MVVTGFPLKNGRFMEILDLEDSSFNCTTKVKFPINVYSATGGLVEHTPIVCGGTIRESDGRDMGCLTKGFISKCCFSLQDNGTWTKEKPLITPRYLAAVGSVVMKKKLVIAGGQTRHKLGETYLLPSMEMVSLTTGASMEIAVSGMWIWIPPIRSCIVKWDANTVLVIGGQEVFIHPCQLSSL